MNSTPDALVKNLLEMNFNYLLQKFSGDLLELVSEKGLYPYEYMDSFKKFLMKKYLI